MVCRVLKSYGMTLAMLLGIAAGGVCGWVFGPEALVVKPVGTAFLNLIFMLIVPLVFCSVTSAVYNMKVNGRMGRMMGITMMVFVILSVVTALFTWFGVLVFNPLKGVDCGSILEMCSTGSSESAGNSLASALLGSLTVSDFSLMLSKANLLPLLVFSIFCGWAAGASGEKGKTFGEFIISAQEVVFKMMKAVMYLAPVGLGCWFASSIASSGGQLMGGFLRVFILSVILSVFFFAGISSMTAAISGKLKEFWKHVWQPSVTSLATSSSAAAMPDAIVSSKQMGISPAIADSVIPIGTNIHKDGSVMAGVLKVTFLMLLCGQSITSAAALLQIIVLGLVCGLLIGAVPGGGFTVEVFICSVLGMDPALVGIAAIINTITDAPATLINVNSNINAALLVSRFSSKHDR